MYSNRCCTDTSYGRMYSIHTRSKTRDCGLNGISSRRSSASSRYPLSGSFLLLIHATQWYTAALHDLKKNYSLAQQYWNHGEVQHKPYLVFCLTAVLQIKKA